MSKFIIECPVCHNYSEAKTGFFAKKQIVCSCGNVMDVKTDVIASTRCPGCGNDVVYNRNDGGKARCPVCHEKLISAGTLRNTVAVTCPTCSCHLNAAKDAERMVCPVCDSQIDVQKEAQLQGERLRALPSVIQSEGMPDALVWKHPLTDFAMGSQLIVHESQEAIFFRNGEALDSFSAGRYTLETGVLPLTEKRFKLPMTGQPFHAEVYFVNLVTLMNIKWGTSSKVGLFDPISGIHVELGASGAFNLRVTDARRLVIRLVGTADKLTREQLFSGDTGYFRTMVMTRAKAFLARVIKENSINVLEIDLHLDTISEGLKTAINAELDEYGLILPEFYVANIVTPDDDPNFKRLRQQHADIYLKTREEQIRKAEAEAAFERKAVEAQTAARMKVIGAQGDADALRVKAQAEAEAYRLQAEAEAIEMRMKGYTYQQETSRQVGIEAMKNNGGGEGGGGGIGGITSDLMSLGVGLGVMGNVIGMTRDAVSPVVSAAGALAGVSSYSDNWDCVCGTRNISGNFCSNCGAKRPQSTTMSTWDCPCGQKNVVGNFCSNCGSKRPETATTASWDCDCGQKGITGSFCSVCGKKKGE